MKKLMMKSLFLLYSYYNRGSSKGIAYESALLAISFIIFINFFSALVATNLVRYLPIEYSNWRVLKYLFFIIFYFIPSYIILSRVFKKEEIIKMEMDKSSMRKGYFLIVSYVILSIVLLVFVINVKK